MNTYRDKVAAAWMGKCLGGAIGMPYEGVPFQLELKESDIYLLDVPNDDLELQLIWLKALEDYGLELSSRELAAIWLRDIEHGCDEYSVAIRNIRHGILPPESGRCDNFFHDGMGAAIRAEIWGLVFAGNPDAAAWFAAQDAMVDHWGDGVWSEQFIARLESRLMTDPDIQAGIEAESRRLPEKSRLRAAIAFILELYHRQIPAEEAKQRIIRRLHHANFTDCVMNLGALVYALLWGEGDFTRSILLAVNCGRDTDCTAASCGAILGIAGGLECIPSAMRRQINDRLSVNDYVSRIPGVPLSLNELIERTCRLHERLADAARQRSFPTYEADQVAVVTPPDRAEWLVLDAEQHDIAAIQAELQQTGRCPEALRQYLVTFEGLNLDLSPWSRKSDSLVLFSFLNVTHPCPSGELIVLSATADVGMTLWFDGRMIMNHHSRQLALPSFHRAEGGAAFSYPLRNGERILVQAKFYNHTLPFGFTLMFGNRYNDHLDGFTMTFENRSDK